MQVMYSYKITVLQQKNPQKNRFCGPALLCFPTPDLPLSKTVIPTRFLIMFLNQGSDLHVVTFSPQWALKKQHSTVFLITRSIKVIIQGSV